MPEWLMQLIGMAGAGVVVYAGIRADLREAMTRALLAAESAGEAHRRIDDLLRGVKE